SGGSRCPDHDSCEGACKDFSEKETRQEEKIIMKIKLRWISKNPSQFDLVPSVIYVCFRCLHKPDKQRMWLHRPRQKLRVELAADHERVLFEFCDFNKFSIGRHS